MIFEKKNISYRANFSYSLIFFILWPFGMFLYSIIRFRNPYAKVYYVLFHILIGYSFVIDPNGGSDSVRYAEEFVKLAAHTTFNDIIDFIKSYFERDESDIYYTLSSYFISVFSDNYRIAFAFWGLVYGFFSMKFITFLIEKMYIKNNLGYIALIFALFTFIPWSGINALRSSTAMFVFLYAFLKIVIQNEHKYFVLVFASILIHWMFFPLVIILIAAVPFKKWLFLPYIIFLSSFILKGFLMNFFTVNDLTFGNTFDSRIDGYFNPDYNSNVVASRASLIPIFSFAETILNIFILISAVFIQYLFSAKKIKIEVSFNIIVGFLLMVYALINISAGNFHAVFRFYSIFKIVYFVLLLYILYYNRNKQILKIASILSAIIVIPSFIIMLRQTIEYTSVYIYFSNLIMQIFSPNNQSLLSIIK